MTAFLLIVIAVLLFVISKFLHNKADSYESSSYTNIVSSTASPPKTLPKLSYWESWKKNHPNEANVIETSLYKNIGEEEKEHDDTVDHLFSGKISYTHQYSR